MVDAKLDPRPDPNIHTYNSPAIAGYYAALDYVTPCERLLFDQYLRPGMSILDLGVGGGRTTPYLSAIAGRYVGVDYAPEMIAACRNKFPQLAFEAGSAADLSRFQPATFDAVVMAFNGMDYVIPDDSRFRALREIHRILSAGGILIFSSHNPRSVLVRASWSAQRVRKFVESVVAADSIFFRPALWSLTAARAFLAASQAMLQSLARAARRLPTRAFWHGDGYFTDPAHGGLLTHAAVPSLVTREFASFGFRPLRALGDDYPRLSRPFVTDWYYYVFSKSEVGAET